jgi:ABC-2 type transport system ATP-binding protein
MSVIEVDGIFKSYRGHRVVDGVSFAVEEGEIFAILGPNGAGKTTTVESIAGLRKVDAGTITVLGLDSQRDRVALRRQVGVQLQESQLPDAIKVWEALDLYASFYNEPASWKHLIDQVGLADKRNARFKELSGGQRQRLSVALALVGNPRIAILDELTSGLDPQARRDTWELIEGVRSRGVTVLLVTHFMEEAERLADRVAVINSGKVVALDTPAGVVRLVDAEQRLRFRPSVPFDEVILASLPEVRTVSRSGANLVVTGTGNFIGAVATALARHQIVANDLRIEQADLDDAFIALTGHGSDAESRGANA